VQAARIDPVALASLASEYAKGMTSIRGRRVQRLLKREFAGAERVVLTRADSGAAAVVGVSAGGAAVCITDGTGRQASVYKWRHGAGSAVETSFDLHKDSLPVLGEVSVSMDEVRQRTRFQALTATLPPASTA
jgi:hypothetical protein